MASTNNYFLSAGDPVKKYVKTIKSKVSGSRLEPGSTNIRPIFFVLETHDSGEFVYEDEVLELYSDRETKHFLQSNRSLIRQGLLQEYNGEAEPVDTSNMLTNDMVQEIASTRNANELTTRLNTYTSGVSVSRILEAATTIGRPKKILDIINARLTALQGE